MITDDCPNDDIGHTDAEALVDAGDALAAWVFEQCGADGIVAVHAWHRTPARRRNRCWKRSDA